MPVFDTLPITTANLLHISQSIPFSRVLSLLPELALLKLVSYVV